MDLTRRNFIVLGILVGLPLAGLIVLWALFGLGWLEVTFAVAVLLGLGSLAYRVSQPFRPYDPMTYLDRKLRDLEDRIPPPPDGRRR